MMVINEYGSSGNIDRGSGGNIEVIKSVTHSQRNLLSAAEISTIRHSISSMKAHYRAASKIISGDNNY